MRDLRVAVELSSLCWRSNPLGPQEHDRPNISNPEGTSANVYASTGPSEMLL